MEEEQKLEAVAERLREAVEVQQLEVVGQAAGGGGRALERGWWWWWCWRRRCG